jgi:RHS repeat-associated protein
MSAQALLRACLDRRAVRHVALRPLWLRRLALLNTMAFCLSFALITPLQALAQEVVKPPSLSSAAQSSPPVSHPPQPLVGNNLSVSPVVPVRSPLVSMRSARLQPAAFPTLLDEVGQMAHPVPAARLAAWKHALHQSHLPARQKAKLRLWLGEVALAHDQNPEQALQQFQYVQRLSRRSSALCGLAAYDRAVALYYEGAYQQAVSAFQHLLAPKTALIGYDRRACALFYRHAGACAGYHVQRAALGIPEPARLDPLCGVAALAACLRSLGLPFDKQRVLSVCRVTGEGSSLQDILKAVQKLGLSAHVVSADDQGLISLPKPLICHSEHDHWVAVVRADKQGVSYLCSDCGPFPGGRVNLTWKQWHALEADAYVAVCKLGSDWDATLGHLSSQPASTIASHGVQLASTRLVGWQGPLPQLLLGQVRLLAANVILSCGTKPNALHCPPFIGAPMHPSLDPCENGPTDGEPVNLATGEEEYNPSPDLVVYNPNGPSVVWQRVYDSLRGGSYNTPYPYNDYDFGMGWSHPYNVYVYDPDGSNHSTKYVVLPNGARIAFTAATVPSASNPTVQCAVQAGAPCLVTWNYVSGNGWGAFTITWPNRTQWFTSPSYKDKFGQHLTQITDRNGHSIYLNLHLTGGVIGAYQLISISTGLNGSGTVLLTITRPYMSLVSSVSDCYNRSVTYQASTSVEAVGQVSQVVTTGTSNPPMRWSYGYLNPVNMGFFLQTITVPSPTGTGNSTATINYDSAGGTYAVTSIVDANGNSRNFSYSTANSSATETLKNAQSQVVYASTVGYNAVMSQTSLTDGNNTIIFAATYADPNDPYRPSQVQDGNGYAARGAGGKGTWTFTWDAFGNCQTVTTPRQTTTTSSWNYTHFGLGELTGTQAAGKQATTFTYYEPSGLVHTVTTPLPGTVNGSQNVTTSFTYDTLGNILSVTGPGNNATSSIATTFNYTTDGGYNQPAALGQPLTITDNLGKVAHFRYDSRGNLLSAVDPLANETDVSYNLVDQPLQKTFPATGQTGSGRSYMQYAYLYPGGPLTSTAAYNESGTQVRQVTLTHGPEGELLGVSGSTEPATLTYDGAYRLQALTDGNSHVTNYYYTTAGYLGGVTYPGYSGPAWPNLSGSDSVQFPSFDQDGNPLIRVDGRGVTTTIAYNDVESLPTAIQYPATPGLNVSLGYDGYGRLNSKSDGAGSYTYSFDDNDALTSTQTTYTGLAAKTLSYGFYPDGSTQTMSTPAGSFAYSYDADGRLSSLTNPTSESFSWTYLDTGWLWKQASNNSSGSQVVDAIATYNALGQITDLTNQNDTSHTLYSDFSSQAHDGVGNLTGMSVSMPAVTAYGGSNTYTYDSNPAKNQLTQEQSTRNGGYTNGFGYDSAGNPTNYLGVVQHFNSDNQNTASGYVYDGNGNPTTYAGSSFAFDAVNRLSSIGSSWSAGYTAEGQRAWQQNGSTTTYFLYDGTTPVCELNSSGTVTATNTFGAAGLLARHTSSGSLFYSFDTAGNVAETHNSSGTPQLAYQFTSFGQYHASTTPSDPFGFGGQAGYTTDRSTGLVLLGQRYYDPGQGRFLTRDPLGYAGGINLYGYVGNNPLNSLDPLGLVDDTSVLGQLMHGSTWGKGLATAGHAFLGSLGFDSNPCHESEPGYGGSKALWNAAEQAAAAAATGGSSEVAEGAQAARMAEEAEGMAQAARASEEAEAAEQVAEEEAEEAASGYNRACFVAGTPVEVTQDSSQQALWQPLGLLAGDTEAAWTKPIETIQPGDVVVSRNPQTGQTEYKLVVVTSVRQVSAVVTLTLADAKSGQVVQTLTATPTHPFFVQGKGFVEAGRLAIGNAIVTRAGPDLIVKEVQQQSRPEGYTVYNFTVADDHTYFVGTANGGAWVHNDACNPNDLVRAILKGKKGSIKNAPLDEGAPAWDDILDKPYREIEEGARKNLPGYKTIRKLLTDKRFDK